MVSPHDDWDDVENGYRRGVVGVVVEQVSIDEPDLTVDGSNAIDSTDTAYAVAMRRPIGSPLETETTLVAFADVRTAWEYANLLTHYVVESADAIFAESQLRGLERPPADRWQPDGLVADLDAASVLRKQVGHDARKVDHLLARRATPGE